MPIHDWTRVTAGTWHAFHLSWIAEIQLALNGGLLPPDYYAQAEGMEEGDSEPDPAIQVWMNPPTIRITAAAEADHYTQKRRTLVIQAVSRRPVARAAMAKAKGTARAT